MDGWGRGMGNGNNDLWLTSHRKLASAMDTPVSSTVPHNPGVGR